MARIRKCFISLSVICLLTSLPALVNADPIKILPFGDSITQGGLGYPSYRRALWLKLQEAGYSVDFVGGQNEFASEVSIELQDFDLDHEGRWAWEAGELSANIATWLLNYDVDIALIHAGTNDIDRGQSNASTLDELGGIISKLRTDNPNVIILLATLIPMQMLDTASFNTELKAWASTQDSPTSPVVVVDQYSGYNALTDNYDNYHPNSIGERKMATRWFDALQALTPVSSVATYNPESEIFHIPAIEVDGVFYSANFEMTDLEEVELKFLEMDIVEGFSGLSPSRYDALGNELIFDQLYVIDESGYLEFSNVKFEILENSDAAKIKLAES